MIYDKKNSFFLELIIIMGRLIYMCYLPSFSTSACTLFRYHTNKNVDIYTSDTFLG